jgi:hypothetical protein
MKPRLANTMLGRVLLVAGLCAASSVLPSFTAAAATGDVPAAPVGWQTVFSDDFAGTAGSPADSNWYYLTGAGSVFGTGEVETMTDSTDNVHLDGNGDMDITALDSGGDWTSGRIQSTPAASTDLQAPAGGKLEVTAAIQQPDPSDGLGYWPAFWMLGLEGQWPENGEIDIMEDVNALSGVAGTIHCGTYPGGPCNEGNGIGSGMHTCDGCQTGYHVYSMILDRTNPTAESITWYLDGTQYFTVSEAQVGQSAWEQAFHHSLTIIFDLAMGGGFPNGVCGCTSPSASTSSGGTMSIDYVAAYTTTGSVTGPVTGFTGLCLDDQGAGTANFNPVGVYTCNGTQAQQWTYVVNDNTMHVLGKCLDVNAGGTADGTTVDLYDCNGTGAQVWIPQSDGELYNPQSDKCLDDTNWSTTPGTQAQIWDCSGNANQVWRFS